MALKSYRELKVWEAAMQLVTEIYKVSRKLPDEEKFGLCSQLRRAVVSIPCNIADGYGRSHRGDYLHHLSFAKGSLMEIETLLTISARLKMIARQDIVPAWKMSQEIGSMLTKLISSLQE
jgi:four helix bundle protein